MKKTISYFFLIFCFLIAQEVNATNPISKEWHESKEIVKKQTLKSKVVAKIKSWTQKLILATADKSKLHQLGLLSLIFGIVSILGWFLISVAGGWVLWVMAALAIAGDILAIMTLIRSRNDKKEHRKARTMAWFGLILSLLTGLLPIFLLIIVLISI